MEPHLTRPRAHRRASLARRGRALLLLGCLALGCASTSKDELPPPSPEGEQQPKEKTGWTKEQKLLAVNAACAGAVLAYGFHYWGYGGGILDFSNEGWFGKDTENGGADKLGHAYAAYLGTIGLASLYESWGYDRADADLYGALSSMGTFTLIEVADGTSHYGFSVEDLIADGMGVLYGYCRRRIPAVGRYVDYRVEYWPSRTSLQGHHTDIATDYSGYKFLLALKLDAFESLRSTPLAWLELQAGYYTRGYGAGDYPEYYSEKTRNLYVAVAINLSRLFSKVGLRKFGQIFEYYQPRYTYIPYDWTLPQ